MECREPYAVIATAAGGAYLVEFRIIGFFYKKLYENAEKCACDYGNDKLCSNKLPERTYLVRVS